MNWRLSVLDRFALVSNSDAHSPDKLGREANLLDCEPGFRGLSAALRPGSAGLLGTLEFYPEEGKYHYDGHRACGVRLAPGLAAGLEGRCPGCGRKLTLGVLHRVQELADRPEGTIPPVARHYERLIPLRETVAEALDCGPHTNGVNRVLELLARELGPELEILRAADYERLSRLAGPLVAEAVRRNREGEVKIDPGYDGEYGTVRLFAPGERGSSAGQIALGGALAVAPRRRAAAKASPPKAPAPVAKADAARSPAAPVPAGSGPFDPFSRLNPLQREAATAPPGPLAVVAGPGTGKTFTLIARAAYLIRERKIPPERLLAVTFTNRAAGELRQRLAAVLGPEAGKKVCAMTIHGFCLRLLAERRGEPPSIADEGEALELLRQALAGLTPAPAVRPAAALEEIGRARAQAATPENYRGPEELRRIWTAYRDLCRRLGVLDYDQLVLEALEGLERDPGWLARVREEFPWLLVDEFQDLSPAQYRLIRLLAGLDGSGLFAIGDPNQSIYGFRGSDRLVFERLRQDWPSLRVLTLGEGYRCPAAVIGCAAALLRGLPGAATAPGPCPRQPQQAPAVRLIRCGSDVAEAIAVVREIGRLVGGTGMLEAHGGYRGKRRSPTDPETLYSFGDCAVVARTGAQLETLEEAFAVEGLPCRLRGGRSFLADREVRLLLSFLRLLVNPRDDFRFPGALRLAGFDPQGEYFATLGESARAAGRPLVAELQARLSREVPISPAGARAAEFLLVLDHCRRLVGRPPRELLESLLERFLPERRERPALALLLASAAAFSETGEFLRRLGAVAEGDHERLGAAATEPRAEAVTLMTMHAAKGLEFKVVFVCAVEEGLVPFTRRESDPEEERRLLFVALTRAAERLYLTSAARRKLAGRVVEAGWSPLVAELPPALLEREEARPLPPADRQLGLL